MPIVGLYYLFIHREEMLKAGAHEFIWGRFLRPGRIGVAGVMAILGAVIVLATQGQAGIAISIIVSVGKAAAILGILALILDWSLATTFFGLAVYVYGIYPGQNDYLKDIGMVITLFGIVLLMTGWDIMRIAWFPIAFLVCALPWPGLVYSWVAEPLQVRAAQVAVFTLELTGVRSNTSGTKIVIANVNPALPPRVLNVAEACAGMRSLMTFISVAAAVAFLSPRPLWQKIIIVISAVPIAIFCNVVRISGQGLLDHYVSPQLSESFAHQFVGIVMFLPAFFLILAVGWLLDQLFIEEADDENPVPVVIQKNVAVAAPTTVAAAPSIVRAAPLAPPPSRPTVAAAPLVNRPAPVRPATPAPKLTPTSERTREDSGSPRPPTPPPAPPKAAIPTPPRPVPPRTAPIPPAYKPVDPAAPKRPPTPPTPPPSNKKDAQ